MTEYTFNQLMMGEHSILLYNAKEKDKYISHIQKKELMDHSSLNGKARSLGTWPKIFVFIYAVKGTLS